MPSWSGKGKGRAVPRDEGSGGTGGIVLPLGVASSSTYDMFDQTSFLPSLPAFDSFSFSAYTLDVYFGANEQKLSLQIDTGSSDLWVVSNACTSSLCSQVSGHNYDPSASTLSNESFSINYLQGEVSGPIVWDDVQIGGYSIQNQAFAAATSILNEPLSPQFVGILGLALPLNSIIADLIPPVTTNAPDGAAWASNLFSITPSSAAPASRFLSISLSRPGDSRTPALFGIGRHPSSLVPDPSQVRYGTLVSEDRGILFWKVTVRAITVYDNGEPKPVKIGRSNTGTAFPTAVLDTGVPLILTTSTIANGIYGAIGVSPANDGNYYVPCTTPLNLTITLDDRPEIPIHPLDLTTEPPDNNRAQYCIGLVQSADNVLANRNSGIGDMILGVPFLRNVYTVMAYSVPDANGTFPRTSQIGNGSSSSIQPRLGLMGLTNATQALEDFRKVRVLNQPLDSNLTKGGSSGSSGGGAPGKGIDGGKKLSVGIIVLIGLLSFFALCMGLFGIRWWLFRRKFRRAGGSGPAAASGVLPIGISLSGMGKEGGGGVEKKKDVEEDLRDLQPTEDVMRTLRYEAYMQYNQANVNSRRTTTEEDSRDSTTLPPPAHSPYGEALVVAADAGVVKRDSEDDAGVGHRHSGSGADELGYRRVQSGEQSGDYIWWADGGDGDVTLVSRGGGEEKEREVSMADEVFPNGWMKEFGLGEDDARGVKTLSSSSSVYDPSLVIPPVAPGHDRRPSVSLPLLDSVHVDEFGVAEGGARLSMAGVGTAARGGRIGSGLRRGSGVGVEIPGAGGGVRGSAGGPMVSTEFG